MVSIDDHEMHEICPECEMPLETPKARECPYCGTVLIDTALDLDSEQQSELLEDLNHEHHGEAD